MITETDLRETTNKFYNLYWNSKNGQYPNWSEHWLFKNTIPNHDKRGCYALFDNDELIYIGIGIGNSFGAYQGNGLGQRLKRYWKLSKKIDPDNKLYTQRADWMNVTSIITVGFPEEHYHIAASLEIYLINKLSPSRNTLHK